MKHWNIVYKGRDDLLRIREKVVSHPADQVLIQAFCGISDPHKIENLRLELVELFPEAAILGASSAGEIFNARVVKHAVVLGISLFEQTKVHTTLKKEDDLEAAGQAVGEAFAASAPKAVIVFGRGLKHGNFTNHLPFLKALSKKLGGDVPIGGGQAGGYDELNSRVCIFTEKGLMETGFAAAALCGEALCVHTAYDRGWGPIGKKMTVTHAEGTRLYALDHQSVSDIYKQYLGFDSNMSSFFMINNFPLLIDKGDTQLTNPIAAINDDGSFELVQELRAGEQVRFSFCDAILQEQGAKRLRAELASFDPEALFTYSCISRLSILGDDITVDMQALECCSSATGFFTFGEYYTAPDRRPHFFQQTMTVLALSETGSCNCPLPAPRQSVGTSENKLKKHQLFKVMSHLFASTTSELEAKNRELAELANKDSLTGLANRRLFDKTLRIRLQEHSRSGSSLSLILLDVDFFKQFNDMYGHVAGDDCLRGVAQVLLRELKRSTDIAFRYGGEEFGCLLSFTEDHDGALMVAERIRAGVERLAIPHETSRVSQYVTVSIGVLSAHGSYEISPEALLKTCDDLLYKAKQHGRNRIVGKRLKKPRTD